MFSFDYKDSLSYSNKHIIRNNRMKGIKLKQKYTIDKYYLFRACLSLFV